MISHCSFLGHILCWCIVCVMCSNRSKGAVERFNVQFINAWNLKMRRWERNLTACHERTEHAAHYWVRSLSSAPNISKHTPCTLYCNTNHLKIEHLIHEYGYEYSTLVQNILHCTVVLSSTDDHSIAWQNGPMLNTIFCWWIFLFAKNRPTRIILHPTFSLHTQWNGRSKK